MKPDLLLIELLLPKMHAIEVIKELKIENDGLKMGIIVMTYEMMVQNYHAALDWGASDFLAKPVDPDAFFKKAELYFSGKLTPSDFCGPNSNCHVEKVLYEPIPHFHESYIKFWGTRGSIAVSGHDHVVYGGNTSCLEVKNGEDLIIFDAGTGICPLGRAIDLKKHKHIHIFISHTHFDHISGFPFFDPLYIPGVEVTIWAPVGFEKDTHELFTDMLAYAYFPVKLDEMRANINFRNIRDGSAIKIGSITVESCYTYHPGPTLGFKITANGHKVGYVTDNEMLIGFHGHPNKITRDHPALQAHLGLIEFLSDCDTLVHEAQYFPEEYLNKVGWGHSSISNATALVKHLNIKEWLVAHHDPKHTDKDLQIKFELHREVLNEAEVDCLFRHARDDYIVPLIN